MRKRWMLDGTETIMQLGYLSAISKFSLLLETHWVCYSPCFVTKFDSAKNSKEGYFAVIFACSTACITVNMDGVTKMEGESQNSRNQGFSYYFCMMIEGSGSGSREGSGSIHLTSGSGWPKNIWIRWIRIRNTGYKRCV
jgi:hypothetical protein